VARRVEGLGLTSGAIEKVIFDDDARCSLIGNVVPVGMCGSGLIDLAAEMLNCGIIASTGRLVPSDELDSGIPDPIKKRVYQNCDGQMEFLVFQESTSRKDLRVAVTQKDIRELQLAVGAIRAGINIMLRKTSTKTENIKHIFIAGGFGSFIRRTNAQRIGLSPSKMDHQKIACVGNTSLNWAKWALLSTNVRKKAEEIAEKTSHIQFLLTTGFKRSLRMRCFFLTANKAN